MKKSKKYISLLLSLIMILSVFSIIPFTAGAAEADTADTGASGATGDCTWSLDNGVLTISGNGKMRDYDSTYKNGSWMTTAPWGGYSFNTVVIESGVTSIGNYAFYRCTSLTSVTIPDSVTSIGEYAFSGCTSLTSVNIPDSVTSIGESAFKSCTGLTSVTIPDSVTSIDDEAFWGCTGLTSVTIPDSVTSIGYGAFYGCTGLTGIDIPDYVTSIGEDAFRGCKGLTSITIPDSVTSIGWSAFYECTSLTSIDIPDSVTSIGFQAFYNCTGLTSVTIPDSVTSIDEYAFFNCTGLKSITIPDSVTTIGEEALGYYYDNGNKKISGFKIYGYQDTEAERYAKNNGFTIIITSGTDGDCTWTLDNGVLTISGNGEMGNYGVTFKNGSNVTTAPWGGYSFNTVVIGNGVTSIGEYAFWGCTGLTSVTIPDSVTSIGGSAFSGCSSLMNVTIGSSVTSIGESAFENCTGLTSVTIGISVTSIGDWAFGGCTGLTSVTIPDSVTSIGWYAFEYCTGLTSVTIPDSVTSIGESAFSGCTGLTSVTIGNSVTSIGYRAFEDTAWYNNQPYGLVYAGKVAYKMKGSCPSEVVIKDGTLGIADYAFEDCTGLKSVTIPDSVTSIGGYAFYYYNDILIEYQKIDGFVVIGYEGSAAEKYAKNNGFTFKAIIGKCDNCNSTLYEDDYHEGYPATCVNGLSDGYICPSCGHKSQAVIPATGHTPGEPKQENLIKSTCTKEGSYDEVTYCTVCKAELSRTPKTIEMLPHTPVTDKAVPATCTKTGLTEGSHCSVCKTVLVEQTVVPVIPHTPGESKQENLIKSTCTKEGSYDEVTYCTVCKAELSRTPKTIEMLPHSPATDKAVPATCTKTGLTEGSHCSVCKTVLVEQTVIPALGHKPIIDKAVEATCQHAGHTIGSYCENCGEVYVQSQVIPKLPHTPVKDVAVPATCTHTGLTEGSHCSVCGDIIVAQKVIAKLQHTAGKTVIENDVPVTCATDGSHDEVVYCTVCKYEISRKTITAKALGHSYDIVPGKPATYLRPRYADGVQCTRCGEWLLEREISSAALTGEGIFCDVDSDGKVTTNDVTFILRDLAGFDIPFNMDTAKADADGDNTLTVMDATAIQRYLVRLSSFYGIGITLPDENINRTLVNTIKLSDDSITLFSGQKRSIKADVLPANADSKALLWTSSDPSVAAVDQSGNVTAVKGGSAAIYATAADGSGVYATCDITVERIKVSSITLSPSSLSIVKGQSKNLTATVAPANAEIKALKWSSSNTSVATVDQSGKVTGVKAGTATIYAAATDGSGVKGSCSVTVESIKVSYVTLSSSSLNIVKGQSKTLTATVTPSDADNKALQWSSSNTSVATVDQSGKVTAVKGGTATIYATATDGSGVKGSCSVTVEVVKVSYVTLSSSSLNILKGQSKTLTATVTPSDADNKALQWSSSNTSVATVDQSGKVTAVKGGTATIYATATDGSGVKGSCSVTVEVVKVSSVTLSSATLNLTEGQNTTLSATVTPSNADNKTLQWSSSNTSVATVDQYGKVTGVKAGTATIYATATDGSGVKGSCTVTVKVNTSLQNFNNVISYINSHPDKTDSDGNKCLSYNVSTQKLTKITASGNQLIFSYLYRFNDGSDVFVSFTADFNNSYTVDLGYMDNGLTKSKYFITSFDARYFTNSSISSLSYYGGGDTMASYERALADAAVKTAFVEFYNLLYNRTGYTLNDIGFNSYVP